MSNYGDPEKPKTPGTPSEKPAAAKASNGGGPTWAQIGPLFTSTDISSMKNVSKNWKPGPPLNGPLDLGDYNSTKAHIDAVVKAVVTDQTMPCESSGENPWSQPNMDLLTAWQAAGCPK